MNTRGVIFDLDETLVESALDFDLMRSEMGLPAGTPILEAIDRLEPDHRQRSLAILARHEERGAARATPVPGVAEFLRELAARGISQGVATRNCRHLTKAVLDRLELSFDVVHTREDGPVKPDPAAILAIAKQWGMEPGEVAVIGDGAFDIESGRRAGARTVLYTGGRHGDAAGMAAEPDFVLHSFLDVQQLLAWLG